MAPFYRGAGSGSAARFPIWLRFRAPVSISRGLQTGVIFSIVPAWRPSYVNAVAILSSHLA
jgi:hypothetical protein